MGGEWNSRTALAKLDTEHLPELASATAVAQRLCRPMQHERLVQRLTALGMVMSPNRSAADGAMWVRECARLLSDIAEDVLCEAIDALQKRMKFLPTVAEIRELADPRMNSRREEFARLDAMRRYVESGQPIPKLLPPQPKPVMDRRGEPMTEADTTELNRILENLGVCSRYRLDGSRYEVEKQPAKRLAYPDRPQMPTRADYISWGVDPAILDAPGSKPNGRDPAEGLGVSPDADTSGGLQHG